MQHNANCTEYTPEEITNNMVTLTGIVTAINGPTDFHLSVSRLSGMADNIPVTLSEELCTNASITQAIKEGITLSVRGQFRSHNKIIGDRSKLMLAVHATEAFLDAQPNGNVVTFAENPNSIELVGFVCKAPIYRTTPFNREIADLLIAVNRSANKSDYIPAIAWGRNARFAKNLLIGEKVCLRGRVQSREYQKRLDDDTVETRTAYEISVNTISRAET